MNYIEQIMQYTPQNTQEFQDKKIILEYINRFPQNVLLRDNEIAHITSSGFIMNKELDKVLFVKHNIMNKWAWTGGHADGDEDLLHVAIKEANEETGVIEVIPLTKEIASIDILTVSGHLKNERYVNPHLHLSVAYILIASEKENLKVKDDENSGVKWISVDKINKDNFSEHDVYLYSKLVQKARNC